MSELSRVRSKLNRKNKKIFSKLSKYIYANGINSNIWNEVRLDIASMLLESQMRGSEAKEVIGDDYKKFCNDLIANCPRKKVSDVIIEILMITTLCLFFIIPLLYLRAKFFTKDDIFMDGMLYNGSVSSISFMLSSMFVGSIGSFFSQKMVLIKKRWPLVVFIWFASYMLLSFIFYKLADAYLVKSGSQNGLIVINLLSIEIALFIAFVIIFVVRELRSKNQEKDFLKK